MISFMEMKEMTSYMEEQATINLLATVAMMFSAVVPEMIFTVLHADSVMMSSIIMTAAWDDMTALILAK